VAAALQVRARGIGAFDPASGNEASLPTLAQINETAARFGERRQTPVELGLVPERDKRATKPATVRR